ncbi:MAG: NUDIX domain-containing protein [Ardenticatenaceae bacterium]
MTNRKAYQEGLPKKRMAAGCLFFDASGKLLIVKPTYKAGWEIPGGIIEKNESPREACVREVQEELGLAWGVGELLGVDYTSESDEYTESLQFIFLGDTLSEQNIVNIRLAEDELSEYRFVEPEQAVLWLNERAGRRVEKCLKYREGGRIVYLENGNSNGNSNGDSNGNPNDGRGGR